MKKILIISVFAFFVLVSLGFVSAVCCEKTLSGFYCQDVNASMCAPGAKQAPTSCASTSYCKPGICFDTNDGHCSDNTPMLICNQTGGKWTDKSAPQCNLGCCILGDQAAFVTLTKCKTLARDMGLETNYKKDIKSEASCIDSVLGQEKGACVYEFEFENTCRITTRADCAGGVSGSQSKGTFFKGKLCTANFASANLTVNCVKQNVKICVPGKEEAYYKDNCGNPANIYDPSQYDNPDYWENMMDKSDVTCDWKTNANCGNCNYLEGSICRTNAKGEAKCVNLNCEEGTNDITSAMLGNVPERKHGESWCVNDAIKNSVGSRNFKYICINGEVITEACDDTRQQVCLSNSIEYEGTTFTQAACRVNRWQDCTAQTTSDACGNDVVRDCKWVGPDYTPKCVPQVSPGTTSTCGQASTTCVAKFEQTPFQIWGPSSNREKEWHGICVTKDGDINPDWQNAQTASCRAVGDCGDKTNWLGSNNRNAGYTLTSDKDY